MTKSRRLSPGQESLPAIAPMKNELHTDREPWAGQKYAPISRLTRHLFLGDYVDGRDVQLLEDWGITAIVNCTHEPHPHTHVAMLCLMQEDHVGLDHNKLDTFFAFMDEHANTNVLIHCALGINRGPTYATAWTMREYQWTWDRAIAFVKWRRRIARPVEAQREAVTTYFRLRYPAIVLTDDDKR